MTVVASIDIGTNTVLLLVARAVRTPEGEIDLTPLLERATITRLGKGVDRTHELAPEASARTLESLQSYARELAAFGKVALDVVGTSALREARGGPDFLERAEAILGVRPRVISGETEAELSFRGALSGLSRRGPVMVFDIGGGSTEFIVGDTLGRIESATSVDLGSVRLHERHLHHDPPLDAELESVRTAVATKLRELPTLQGGLELVGVAGTVTTLAAIELGLARYEPERVHGSQLPARAVEALALRLSRLQAAERAQIPGLEPGRADVIVAGALLLSEVLKWAGATELTVSDRGVRWGLALELAARSPQ